MPKLVHSVVTAVPPSSCLIGNLAPCTPVPRRLPPSNWRPMSKEIQQQGFNNDLWLELADEPIRADERLPSSPGCGNPSTNPNE